MVWDSSVEVREVCVSACFVGDVLVHLPEFFIVSLYDIPHLDRVMRNLSIFVCLEERQPSSCRGQDVLDARDRVETLALAGM